MDLQVAGPSRLSSGYDSGSLTYRDRQRLLAHNHKAERVLGTPASASSLKLNTDVSGTATEGGREPVVLNSPVSNCPPSFQPWSARFAANAHTTSSIVPQTAAESVQLSARGPVASVAPLNFKRRPRRKSLSLAKIETEMADYKRDASFAHNEPATRLLQADSHWQRTIDSSITRRQSLPEVLPASEEEPKRQPRPLPPVPLSRPASPASSISSFNSHNSPRPLPTPPTQSPVPTVSPITFAPSSLQSISPSTLPSPSPPPRITRLREPISKSEPEPFSPLSPISIITDFSSASRAAPSPRSPRGSGPAAKKRHQLHASPYKLARNPTRYSTTSLSSQVSVPPVPPPAELRRRNRNKMAKLIRVLGDSPPSDMVFAADRTGGPSGVKGVEKAIAEEPAEGRPSVSPEPLQRSVSLDLQDTASIFGKSKKALSDPDAGHGVRSQCPVASRAFPPTSFMRLRSKKGRTGNDKAPRYVVSLFGTAGSATPERLTFKLNASAPKMRPTGSYLRGAYKSDMKPVEVKAVPPLPTSLASVDVLKQSQKWVRETGQDRWEVDDYENVVRSLRKL